MHMITHHTYGELPDQFGELRTPANSHARPLVVLIHGGFWRDQYHCDLMHPLAESLYDAGYASWNIEYRRVGPTGGGYPTTLTDVRAGIDHVTGPDWSDPGWPALVVIGHSAGGHLALWNASRADAGTRPALTIGLAAVADVIAANRNRVGVDATTNFFGGDIDDVPENYAAGQPNPASFHGRVVLIHGDTDDSVPLAQSYAIADHVDRLEVLEGVDHFDVINPDHASWQIVVDELTSLDSSVGETDR